MTKLTKSTAFKNYPNTATETRMDKTTRIAQGIIDGEAKQHQAKIARLRKTRLEREASTPVKPIATAPKKTDTNAPAKVSKKR